MSNNPDRSTAWRTALTVIQTATPPPLPEGAEVMTVVIEYPPGDPGAPPHRHPGGPAFGRRAFSKPAKRSGNPAVT